MGYLKTQHAHVCSCTLGGAIMLVIRLTEYHAVIWTDMTGAYIATSCRFNFLTTVGYALLSARY